MTAYSENGHHSAGARVLVVDDAEANREFLARVLRREGYVVDFACNGREALDAVHRAPPDVVLMDVRMPDVDGVEACRTLKHDAATRLVPVVLITALNSADDRLEGINAGADDFLSKPFNVPELRARVRSLIRLKRHTDDLDTADAVITSLALTIEARDECTEGHCQRLAKYARALGLHLNLGEADLAALARGAYLHDIGKVGIPDAILLKAGRLTPAEYELMKQHTVIGDRLCGELRSLRLVRPIVRHHHERLNGTGYPDALRGDAIPLVAQITGIVDVFDALTTDRPYKTALSVEHACDELTSEAARGWRDSKLVEMFIGLAQSGGLSGCDVPGAADSSS